jgi:hypothetical protein
MVWTEEIEGVNLVRVHCTHVQISKWNPFAQIIYANKIY